MNRIADELFVDRPHRRLNALTGEWVFVSPHRAQRPWQGRSEPVNALSLPAYDPSCYLCPCNVRANGVRNPAYTSIYVFTNDFPAFLPDIRTVERVDHPLLRAQSQAGVCRVMCFSPRHDVTLAQLSARELRAVIDAWAEQVRDLGQRWRWVQIFENKGELMGCSNPHPHGQVWAGSFLPNEPTLELRAQEAWFTNGGTSLLLDYVETECQTSSRLVVSNAHWVALVPWWAIWPYEALVLPRRAVQRLPELTVEERDGLADLLKRLLKGYDALFDTPFPYSMGWHGAPTDEGNYQSWQLHAHIYPPLLRSAAIRKFMVGYELLAECQRDLLPEEAAARLRAAVVRSSDASVDGLKIPL